MVNEEKRNQFAARCERCGEMVDAGKGLLRRVATEGGYGFAVTHADDCSPAEGAAPEPMRWAVPAFGRTAAGLGPVPGASIVTGARPRGDAWALNEAARAAEARTTDLGGPPEPEDREAAKLSHRRWLGFCYLEHVLPRPPEMTMDGIAALLEGADVAAMRERHNRAVMDIRERYSGLDPKREIAYLAGHGAGNELGRRGDDVGSGLERPRNPDDLGSAT